MRALLIFTVMLSCASSNLTLFGQTNEDQFAIVFIPGIGGSSLTWNDAIAGLSQECYYRGNLRVTREENTILINFENKVSGAQHKENRLPMFTLDFSGNDDLNFIQQAEELKKVCKEITGKTGIHRYLFIGHSTGGLAARRFIMDYGPETIVGMITIATPHLGSFLGYARDLSEQSPVRPVDPKFRLLLDQIGKYKLIDQKELQQNPFAPLFNAYQFTTGIDYLSKAAHYLKPSGAEMRQLFRQEFPETLPLAIVISDYEPTARYDADHPEVWFETNKPFNIINMVDPANGFDLIRDVLMLNLASESSVQCTAIRQKIPVEILTIQYQTPANDGLATTASQDIRPGVVNGYKLHPDYFYTNRFHTDAPGDVECLKKAIGSVLTAMRR